LAQDVRLTRSAASHEIGFGDSAAAPVTTPDAGDHAVIPATADAVIPTTASAYAPDPTGIGAAIVAGSTAQFGTTAGPSNPSDIGGRPRGQRRPRAQLGRDQLRRREPEEERFRRQPTATSGATWRHPLGPADG
jgi:hypothetical protein